MWTKTGSLIFFLIDKESDGPQRRNNQEMKLVKGESVTIGADERT